MWCAYKPLEFRRARSLLAGPTMAVCVFLAACSGSTGPAGPPGAGGSTGPPSTPGGPVTAINISTATRVSATVTGVTIPTAPAAAKPVVKFQLLNQVGQPLSGLTAGQISFAVAKLVPAGSQLAAVPPQTAAPAPLVSSQWQSYIYLTAAPAAAGLGTTADPVVGTTPQPQATIEPGTAGTFVDNGDGTYQYTFAKDIASDPAVTYSATLTHRVGFEIRGVTNASGTAIAANSPVYTFQPSTGATTGIAQFDIVEDQTCKNCHQVLAWHGGARTEIKYCVLCHNPSSLDPSSGNSLDFKVMFHKIHMGEDLPTVTGNGVAQKNYYIFGFRNSIADYSTVAYPQSDASANNTAVSGTGQRFCATCHDVSDTNTPQAGNFSSAPSAAACGSCHDNVNFATGAGHSSNVVADDSQCSTCHGPTSNINNGALRVVAAHQTPVDAAITKFQYTVVSITNTAPGQVPVATIKVTDPTNGNAPYDITTAGGPFQSGSSSLRLDVAWNTIDFNNIGSGSATGPSAGTPNQPVVIDFKAGGVTMTKNADGSFSKPATIAIPAGTTGSGVAALEGRVVVPLANIAGLADIVPTGTTATSLGVKGAELNYAITDTAPTPRTAIVDIAKCNVCHRVLTLHGENRTDNINLCASCHNPNATDAVVHIAMSGVCAAGTPDNPIDFKFMIHQIHASGDPLAYPGGVTICAFGGNAATFNVRYPSSSNASLGNCTACHNTGTYYPVDPSVIQGTTMHAGADRQILTDDVVVSPNSAVCSSCHTDTTAITHMKQNGGDFAATKTATGALNPASTETCSVCHAAGGIADVAVVHKLASYQ